MFHSHFFMRLCLWFIVLSPFFLFAGLPSSFAVSNLEFERLQEKDAQNPTLRFDDIPEDERADNPKAWKKRGIELFQKGDYQGALEAFNQLILLKEKDPIAWNHKGEALIQLYRDTEGLAAFEKALRIRPRLTRALHNKGAILLDMGRLQESLGVYKLLIRRNASDPKAWKEKAEVLFLLGRNFEALDAVSQALDLNPRFQAADNLKEKLKQKIESLRYNL